MCAVWHFRLNVPSFLNSHVSVSLLSYKCQFGAEFNIDVAKLLKLFLQNEIIHDSISQHVSADIRGTPIGSN